MSTYKRLSKVYENSKVIPYDYSFTAITSISTKPFFGSVLTATAERAGNAPSN